MAAEREPLPKLLIDARMVSRVPHGFSRYVTRLAEGLRRLERQKRRPYTIGFLVNRETPREELHGFETHLLRSPFLSPLEVFELPGALARLGTSAYHSPTFSSAPGISCPWVVTIHDLNHLHYGSAARKLYYRHLLRPFAQKSRALLTVSEFSRQELARWLKRPETSIGLAPNALDPGLLAPLPEAALAETLARFGLVRGKFFFCLSNPKPHKNVKMLVEAYRGIADTEWPLVLSLEGFENVAGVRAVRGVSDVDGRALLQAAGAVCFPSLYEGFGLPPVEAVCAGAPLLVSDIPPHREGLSGDAGDGARWLDPRALDAWTEAMREARRGGIAPATREARERLVSRFSIDALGLGMDRIYRNVLGLGEI